MATDGIAAATVAQLQSVGLLQYQGGFYTIVAITGDGQLVAAATSCPSPVMATIV